MITIQEDRRESDGVLPYPIHVDEDGTIGQQSFYQGILTKVVGFYPTQRAVNGITTADEFRNLDESVTLEDFWSDPKKVIGMFVISTNKDGQLAFNSLAGPVDEVEVHDDMRAADIP